MFILVFIMLFMAPGVSHAGWNFGYHDHYHGRGHDHWGLSFSIWEPGPYYYHRGYYGGYGRARYVYVDPPTVVYQAAPQVQAVPQEPEIIKLNIPNTKGSFTEVTIKRSGDGFVGPQGEFYKEFPKVSELKVIYGKS